MRLKLKKLSLMSALLAAFALTLTTLTLTPVTAFAAPLLPSCPAGWHFDNPIDKSTNFKAVTPLYGQTNTTNSAITVTLTATVAGTVSFTSGNSTGIGLNLEFVNFKADVNSAVTYSITSTVGHAVSKVLSPGQSWYGKYGVERQSAELHLYYVTSTCQITNDHGYVLAQSPWYLTWKLSSAPF